MKAPHIQRAIILLSRVARSSIASCAPFLAALTLILTPPISYAQSATNPVPFIGALQPASVAPGGADFTLTVFGANFVNGGSAIYWNGVALPDSTTCTAANPVAAPPTLATCTVTVRSAKIASAGTAKITVANTGTPPASNVVFLPMTHETSNVTTSRQDLSTGAVSTVRPYAIAAGDFNGDGYVDLAVANQGATGKSSMTILLGDGSGGFTMAPSNPLVIDGPDCVAVGDFNGDGKLDLAVGGYVGVTILLGDGAGNFSSAAKPVVGVYAVQDLAIGDFNGDGKLDLAVANNNWNAVTVLLGDGAGNFTAVSSPVAGYAPFAVAVGDFNGDGRLDLAVANYCSALGCANAGSNNSNVTILLGDGTGNFTTSAFPALSFTNPISIAVGDFNHDGKLDLAVLGLEGPVDVFLGDGSGNFAWSATLTATSNPPGIEVAASGVMAGGDFNGDGNIDLVVATYGSAVVIYFGDGTGNFIAAPPMTTDNCPYGLAVGDFNGDGRLDFATANYEGITATVLLQAPQLTISKTHTGNFTQGQTGAMYTIASQNTGSVGTLANSAKVTVTDTLPAGLIATALNGDGWDCSSNPFPVTGNGIATVGCSRSDALAPGASFPAIALTANIAGNAPASLMNTATVTLTGQSESDTSNSTATDPTTIVTFAETFSSTSLTFPDQLVGAGSAAQAVMLTNVGTGALQIDSVAASGDFVQTNECGSSVAVGATCTISITFTPTVPGKRTGSVTVTDNAAGSPHAISLSGTGIAPQASLSPSSLTFTSQYVGTSGLPQNITITNTGTAPLTIANVQASSSFGETSGCTSSLAVNVSCTIGVFFDPTASGQVAGSLTITDNGVGSPQTVSLSGVGEDFSFTLASNSSTSATVAPGQMATFTMLLSPGGGFNHTVSLACTGAPISSSCTAAPGVVTLNPNGPTAVIISVPTTAASTVAPFRWLPPLTPRQNGWPLFLCLGISLMIAALGLAVRSGRGRAPARRVALLLVAVAVLIAPALMSCGGAPMAHSPGTPGGIYTLNVAATFSSGTIQLTHNVQLTLTVR